MQSPMASSLALPWPRQIAARLVFMWPLKAFGTMAFMVLFFWAYFAVLHNPLTPPFVMPVTWLDTWIGFSPSAFPAYVSLWVYVSLAPALMGNLRALFLFGLWMGAMCVFCLTIFWAFPTSMPSIRPHQGTGCGRQCLSLAACRLGRVFSLVAQSAVCPDRNAQSLAMAECAALFGYHLVDDCHPATCRTGCNGRDHCRRRVCRLVFAPDPRRGLIAGRGVAALGLARR
jgi:hypothetical protein